MRGCVQLQWIFWKTLTTHLPILWRVIYERTCTHHTECSAVFDQTQHDPHALPSLFTWSCPEGLFFISLCEKHPWRETFCQCGRGETKRWQKHKSHQNEFKNCFEQWIKHVDRCIIKWSVLWRGQKVTHVRIDIQFLTNAFRAFGSPLEYFSTSLFFNEWRNTRLYWVLLILWPMSYQPQTPSKWVILSSFEKVIWKHS